MSTALLQRVGEQLQVGEAVFFEEGARQLGDRQVEAPELAGEIEHSWRRRWVLEAPVSNKRGVEADRGVAVQGRPSSPIRRRTSTPLAAAIGSMTLIVP